MKQSTRVTVRTGLQWTVSVAAALPGIVAASGVEESLPWVGIGLTTALGITRVMALPSVQGLLARAGLATDLPDDGGVEALARRDRGRT